MVLAHHEVSLTEAIYNTEGYKRALLTTRSAWQRPLIQGLQNGPSSPRGQLDRGLWYKGYKMVLAHHEVSLTEAIYNTEGYKRALLTTRSAWQRPLIQGLQNGPSSPWSAWQRPLIQGLQKGPSSPRGQLKRGLWYKGYKMVLAHHEVSLTEAFDTRATKRS